MPAGPDFSLQMISSPEPPTSPVRIPVAIDGREAGDALATWVIGDAEPEPGLKLIVTLPDGRCFEHIGPELFRALFELRREKLDPLAIKLCCNGARRYAWASSMVAEQDGGLACYLLHVGMEARYQDLVQTLAPAPLDAIATAAEQLQFYELWSSQSHYAWLPEERTDGFSRQVLEAVSWRLVAEVARRAPNRLAIFETHPGGGQHDCLTVREMRTGQNHLDVNRRGSVKVYLPGEPEGRHLPWAWLLGPAGITQALESIDYLLGLTSKLPSGNASTVAYRVMAEVAAQACLARLPVRWLSGYHDTSGLELSSVRWDLFKAFRQVPRNLPAPWRWLGDPSCRYWFLVIGDQAVAAIDHAFGRAWDLHSAAPVDLLPVYRKERNIWAVSANALPKALRRMSSA